MFSLVERCSVPGCGNRVAARGLCWKHYERVRRHGHVDYSFVRRMCPACLRWFKPSRSDQVFDTVNCRVAWFRRRKVDPRLPMHPDTRPVVAHRGGGDRRVRRHVPLVPFTKTDVFVKCGFRCVVCHKPVDRSLPPGFPESPAFAWRVPPSVCGVASLENRVVVHEKCLARLKGGSR